jgi:hypothetical protein
MVGHSRGQALLEPNHSLLIPQLSAFPMTSWGNRYSALFQEPPTVKSSPTPSNNLPDSFSANQALDYTPTQSTMPSRPKYPPDSSVFVARYVSHNWLVIFLILVSRHHSPLSTSLTYLLYFYKPLPSLSRRFRAHILEEYLVQC